MKFLIITVLSIPESVAAATRCADSIIAFGLDAEIFPAFTPADDPMEEFKRRGWPTERFKNNHYSRTLPCMSCFLSHAMAWERCVKEGRTYGVAEHDAVFVRELPSAIHDGPWAVNIARPSYGGFAQPPCGLSEMKHKPKPHYMGGATAYVVRPQGARDFLRLAPSQAQPTDIFLSLMRFPFLKDYFPWCVECREEFSTIQRERGCLAKHRPVELVEPNDQVSNSGQETHK